MDSIILLILILVVTACSVRLRVRQIRQAHVETKPQSPLAEAIGQLIATAGGIYLSFLGIMSFIKLQIPELISLYGVSFDPLAVLALLVSLIQPVLLDFYQK